MKYLWDRNWQDIDWGELFQENPRYGTSLCTGFSWRGEGDGCGAVDGVRAKTDRTSETLSLRTFGDGFMLWGAQVKIVIKIVENKQVDKTARQVGSMLGLKENCIIISFNLFLSTKKPVWIFNQLIEIFETRSHQGRRWRTRWPLKLRIVCGALMSLKREIDWIRLNGYYLLGWKWCFSCVWETSSKASCSWFDISNQPR